MDFIYYFIDLFLHLDKHLSEVINNYGTLTYVILFLIIFVETGLVIMPFLPGDSLLFAAAALAANPANDLNVYLLFVLLIIAAFLGDTVNYAAGHYIGPKVFHRDYKLIKRSHLQKTHEFYEKHGGKTIIMARFIPIIRTFAPFVAGIGAMKYSRFIMFNIVGALLWVGIFLFLGYKFGELPIVKENFSLVVLAIIFLSLLPPVIEYFKSTYKKVPVVKE